MKFLKKIFVPFFIIILISTLTGHWLSDKYVVPIMMYHNVDEADELRTDTVSPQLFKTHMAFLQQFGYDVISLEAYSRAIKEEMPLSRKTVVLTFDDGYANNFNNALPVLQEYGFPATVFLSPGFIAEKGYLTKQQILDMKGPLLTFGSHGMTQSYLPDLQAEQQELEIKKSKEVLEKITRQPITHFSYPVGGFNHSIKNKVRRAGYTAALTTNRGSDRFNKDLYELNRIRFSDKDNSKIILWTKLSGYYNLFRELKNPF